MQDSRADGAAYGQQSGTISVGLTGYRREGRCCRGRLPGIVVSDRQVLAGARFAERQPDRGASPMMRRRWSVAAPGARGAGL